MNNIIKGNEVAQNVKDDIKNKIATLKQQNKRIPKLVVIIVGQNPASLSYVKGKEKACEQVGMENILINLDANISEQQLIDTIEINNKDITVDGILVQLPLPKHINADFILQHINPDKDVDGFHPLNIGKLLANIPTFNPCTPKGIMYLLKSIGYDDLSGKHAIVIGRSNIVGKPLALLLLQKNATVTICHSKTPNIKNISKQADIVIVAIGKPRYIDSAWIKEGAVVIDVGINHDHNNKLCGDVDFDAVVDRCAFITPVPKGVGPMTIAMLIVNTFDAYNLHESSRRNSNG